RVHRRPFHDASSMDDRDAQRQPGSGSGRHPKEARVGRKVVRLTLDHLEELTAPCRTCLFWQLDPVRRERVEDPADELDAWVSAVLRDWGSCGRVVLVDGAPKGFALYAPESFLPGAAAFATAPVSADAVLLTQVYVAPDARRGGLGRMLVQGMARD